MSFIETIRSSMTNLAEQLNIPQLRLDDGGECHLRYKDQFDLSIVFVENTRSIQLHAYIHTLLDDEGAPLMRFLLTSNFSNIELQSAQFSIDELTNSVVLNGFIFPETVGAESLYNIISRFIAVSDHAQQSINTFLRESPELDGKSEGDPFLQSDFVGIKA